MQIAESYARAIERMVRDQFQFLEGREFRVSFSKGPAESGIMANFKVEGDLQDPDPGLLEFLEHLRIGIENKGLSIGYTRSRGGYVEYEALSSFATVEDLLRANGLLMQASLYSMSSSDGKDRPPPRSAFARFFGRLARLLGLSRSAK